MRISTVPDSAYAALRWVVEIFVITPANAKPASCISSVKDSAEFIAQVSYPN